MTSNPRPTLATPTAQARSTLGLGLVVMIDDVIINDGTDDDIRIRYTLHRNVIFSYLDRRRTLTRRRPHVDFDRHLVSVSRQQ